MLLLIIYTDGTEQIIPDVEDYGRLGNEASTVMYYIKDNIRSFVPIHAIRHMGRYIDYYREESV